MAETEVQRVLAGARRSVSQRKAAERIADELRYLIVRDGGGGGYILVEHRLIEHFEVSRPTLREALRVLESEGLLKMRRGIRGGAVVQAPAVEDTAHRFGIYLQMQDVTEADVFLVRTVVEPAAARLAAQRVAAGADASLLEKLVVEERRVIEIVESEAELGEALVAFHDAVPAVAGSPTLHTVARLLDSVVTPQAQASIASIPPNVRLENLRRSHEAHRRIADTILRGDAARAEHLMRRHVEAICRVTVHDPDRRIDMFHRSAVRPTVTLAELSRPLS